MLNGAMLVIFFYCPDDQLVIMVLNNVQIKKNYFFTTWYSNLGFETLHIQAIRRIQKKLTSPYCNVEFTI